MPRITERELRIPALCIAASQPDGKVTTTALIAALATGFKPLGLDLAILVGRRDTRFSQKVRNLISHRGSRTNLLAEGFIEYTGEGIQITPAGRNYLSLFGIGSPTSSRQQ